MHPLYDATIFRVVHYASIYRLKVVVGLSLHTRRLDEGEKDVQTDLEGFRSHLVQSHIVDLEDSNGLLSSALAIGTHLIQSFFLIFTISFFHQPSIPGHFPLIFALLDRD